MLIRLQRALCLALLGVYWLPIQAAPTEVSFPSLDGATQLRAYLFMPSAPGPWPAVVMLHGRAGPYSSLAKGQYNANTLSQRHLQWGQFWADRGVLGLHVDSFGPRGFPEGFPMGSYRRRPGSVSEQTVRPQDAYAALAWLRQRPDVLTDRIGLQGWSNGAMAGLATLGVPYVNVAGLQIAPFRAALLFYPGCAAQLSQDYRPNAPALVFVASDDEEVAPLPCQRLVDQLRARGDASLELIWYDGASHGFDDPGRHRQSVPANRQATEDAKRRAESFFRQHLSP